MAEPDRRNLALALIDPPHARGVEVGPSFSPFVPKRSGADITVVDHADADTLRDKYRVHGVDIDAIEPVDVIWTHGSLADALRESAPFDYIIASHLLEHLPDPLGFLDDCHTLLRPGGVVSLVLPDHRFCFDALRPPTTIGQWVDASYERRQRHTPGMVLDHHLYAVTRGSIAWSRDATAPLATAHERGHVDEMLASARKGEGYVDVHAWVFTPASFRALIELAATFGFIDFSIAYEHDTVGYEFFTTLRKPETHKTRDSFDNRLRLFEAVLEAELVDRSPAVASPPERIDLARRVMHRIKGLR